jgi:glycine cleavage system H protein
MKLDAEARYAESHEWARKDGGGITIGISDHAQESLGDIVFVELPPPGAVFQAGAAFGVVESVKAASDVYAPVGGTVRAVNEALADQPDLVNKDCYGQGWFIRIEPDKPGDWDKLLSPADYEKLTGAEGAKPEA